MEKLPDTRTYEIAGSRDASRTIAFEKLLRDIKAANDLDIPFTVKTVASKEFRDGGNVNRANVLSYVVVLGETTAEETGQAMRYIAAALDYKTVDEMMAAFIVDGKAARDKATSRR